MKILAVIVIVVASSLTLPVEEGPLIISLFYEGDCPDCHVFMDQQLLDVWSVLEKDNNTKLELVPFGNAEQSLVEGKWRFKCQHGPEECFHNKMHACAIYQACGDLGTVSCERPKVHQVLEYFSCINAEDDQQAATPECTKDLSFLTSEFILECAKSDQGSQLLSKYGVRTSTFVPEITYVPYVAVNGVHDEAAEDNLIKRLRELRPSLRNSSDTEEKKPIRTLYKSKAFDLSKSLK